MSYIGEEGTREPSAFAAEQSGDSELAAMHASAIIIPAAALPAIGMSAITMGGFTPSRTIDFRWWLAALALGALLWALILAI